MRPTQRRGWTLVELCVTAAIMSLLLGLALRMVFLTDRAMSKGTAAATATGQAMTLAAHLSEDIRMASRVTRSGDGLALALPDGTEAKWQTIGRDTLRTAGSQRTGFTDLRVSFPAPDAGLIRATITDRTGVRLDLAIHPRNTPGGGAL